MHFKQNLPFHGCRSECCRQSHPEVHLLYQECQRVSTLTPVNRQPLNLYEVNWCYYRNIHFFLEQSLQDETKSTHTYKVDVFSCILSCGEGAKCSPVTQPTAKDVSCSSSTVARLAKTGNSSYQASWHRLKARVWGQKPLLWVWSGRRKQNTVENNHVEVVEI